MKLYLNDKMSHIQQPEFFTQNKENGPFYTTEYRRMVRLDA